MQKTIKLFCFCFCLLCFLGCSVCLLAVLILQICLFNHARGSGFEILRAQNIYKTRLIGWVGSCFLVFTCLFSPPCLLLVCWRLSLLYASCRLVFARSACFLFASGLWGLWINETKKAPFVALSSSCYLV